MPKGERHPTIPHLIRKPQPRTAGGDMYPHLPAQSGAQRLQSPPVQPLARSLLPDATRGGLSPLGGAAVRSSR